MRKSRRQCLARLAEDHLGHEDDGQLFFRIDPERGPGSTASEILAERAWQGGLGYIDVDAAAERKADPGVARPAEHPGQRQIRDLPAVGQVVQLNRATVFGPRICTPSSVPPFNIMRQKRR